MFSKNTGKPQESDNLRKPKTSGNRKPQETENLREIAIKTSLHTTTLLTTPYKHRKGKANTMNTIQDKSKAPVGKVQDTNVDTKSIHENQAKSKQCSECINLLEHNDLVETAGELVRLQAQIHRADKNNYNLQTLETHRARYATMKREFDSELRNRTSRTAPPNKQSSRRAKVTEKNMEKVQGTGVGKTKKEVRGNPTTPQADSSENNITLG